MEQKRKKYRSGIRYPMYDLADGIKVANLVSELGGGRIEISVLAEGLGYKVSTATHHINSAKHFGLVEQSRNIIVNTEIGDKISSPISSEEKAVNLIKAFQSCGIFANLFERYQGKTLPDIKIIANLLQREYKLSSAAKNSAAENFISSAKTAGLIKEIGNELKCAMIKDGRPIWEDEISEMPVSKQKTLPSIIPATEEGVEGFEIYKRDGLYILINPENPDAIKRGIRFLKMLQSKEDIDEE